MPPQLLEGQTLTKVTIAIETELNLAKFTLFLLNDEKVDLPQINGAVSIDLTTGTYDISVASKGNNGTKKAKFTIKTNAGSITKSVRSGTTGKVAGFVQFTLNPDGSVSA
ncbi:MAG: hypothetical protein RL299_2263 [Pseudomonadota bacterium]